MAQRKGVKKYAMTAAKAAAKGSAEPTASAQTEQNEQTQSGLKKRPGADPWQAAMAKPASQRYSESERKLREQEEAVRIMTEHVRQLRASNEKNPTARNKALLNESIGMLQRLGTSFVKAEQEYRRANTYKTARDQRYDSYRQAKAVYDQAQYEIENPDYDKMLTELGKQRAQAEGAYQQYIDSDEYQAFLAGQRAANAYAMGSGHAVTAQESTAPYGAAAQGRASELAPEEQKVRELKTLVDYYKNQENAMKDRQTMMEHVAKIEAWPEDDQALMRQYAENTRDANIFLTDDLYSATKADEAEKQLREKYGLSREELRKIAEGYRWYLNELETRRLSAGTAAAVDGGFWASAGHSIGSVGGSLVGAVTAPLDYLSQSISRTGQFRTLDPNAAGNLPNVYSDTVLSEVAANIKGDGKSWGRNLASYLYQGTMGAANSAARLAVSGGNPAASVALAGLGSFGQTVSDVSKQGASPGQALALGTIAGGMEALTEKIPLDNLLDVAKGGWKGLKPALTEAFKQAAIEVTEEELTLIGTTLMETVILQEKASTDQRIQQLVAEGSSLEEATDQVLYELLGEAIDTAAVSGFSGGLSSAGGSTVAYLGRNTSRTKTDTGNTVAATDSETAYQETAKQEPIQPGQVMLDTPRTNLTNKDPRWTEAKQIAAETGRNITFYTQDDGRAGYVSGEVTFVNTESNLSVKDSIVQITGNGTENTGSVPQNNDPVAQNQGFVSGDVGTAQMVGIDIMQIQRLAKATGREIVFFTAPKTENGVDNGRYRAGKIYINVNSENPVAQIFSHELTHSVEMADSYEKLRDTILNRIQQSGGDLYQLRQDKKNLYAKMGQNLSPAEVDSEIVAEYVEKNLLTDEQAIMDVVRHERSLAQKIKKWIDRLLAKLGNTNAQERVFLERARDLYAKALSQTQSSFGGDSITTQQGTDQTAEFDESGWSTNEDAIRWARLELAAGRMTQEEFDEISDAYARFMEQENAKEPVEMERHSFGGVNAKTADMDALERAKQMESQQIADETIRQETGWFRGMDGKWRWEIDDSKMRYFRSGDALFREMHPEYTRHQKLMEKWLYGELTAQEESEFRKLDEIWGNENQRLRDRVNRGNAQLQNIIQHEELFEAYPQLRGAKVLFENLPDGTRAQWDPQRNTMTVSPELRSAPEDTLVHEIQHAIQQIEEFSPGSSVEYWKEQRKDIIETIAAARKNLDMWLNDIGYQEARDKSLLAASRREKTMAQHWQDMEEFKANSKYARQIAACEEEIAEFQRQYDEITHGMTAYEQYRNTAGEIEARDAASRRNLDTDERKNTPPNLGDENTVFAETSGISLEQSIDEYPYNMQTVIREYMDAVDQNVLSFIEEVQTGDAWKSKKVNVGNVSARMAEAIDRLTGVKGTEGNPIVLNTVTVEHIMKRHGSMGEADQSMRNNLDLARVNFVLQNFDNAELSDKKSFGYRNRDNSPSQNILFSKKINGTYFVIEAVPNTGKTGIVSAYINKKGVLQVLDDNAPSSDVRNVPAYTPTETLPQENSIVKEKHSYSAAGDQMANEEYAQTEGKTSDTSAAVTRDTLPRKAREYLARTEWKLLDKIGQSLSIPRFAQQNTLKGIVQEISDEYLSTGRVSDDTINSLFDRAYKEGVVADREFYEQYKEVKDHMRTTGVTLSDQDKSNIADFSLFRKSTMGTLRIVNKGGLPVDVAYMKLQGMAPELFPEDITHPADQLMRMFEVSKSIAVSERTLNEYYGESASDFRTYAKNDFDAAIGDIMSELRNVKRYADDRAATQEAADEAPKTPEEAKQYYAQLKDARRKYDRVMAKNLLTDHDSAIVGKLLTGQISLENLDPNTENVKGIAAAYEAKQEYERIAKLLAEYRKNIKTGHRSKADGYLETANNWKDKGSGLAYSRETMERNVEDIVPDRELAKRINREYFETVRDAEAKATRFKNKWRDRVRALNLSRMKKRGNALSEASAVQLLGEALDNIRVLEKSRGRMKQRDGKTLREWRDVVDNVWAENPNLDADKIENAIKEFRNMYDELFELMNDVRIANGYEPANYRSGYFPHFQPGDGDSVLAHFGKALGIDTSVTALPTTINGLTHTFKPGIQWFGNAQERIGFNTTYDAVEGFDKYIEGIAGVIYKTENIQKLRALGTQIRYRTSDEGIRKQVDAVYADPNLTEEQKQAQIEYIYKNAKYALSNFVNELDEYTNLLANKKSRLDRTVESLVGRTKFYNIMKWLERRVGANMIGGNLSSAVTNFIPLTQALGQLSTKNLLHGMWDARRNIIKGDGFVDASSFLTNRRGSDPIAKAWTEKVGDGIGIVMEMIDDFVSYSVTKGAYYQNLQRGLSETEAVHQADIFAARVMAERSKGGMPTLFESRNPVIKLFTQFQLEVNNQFSEVFKDMPRAYKNKALLALGLGFLKYFLGAWMYNELFEKITGRRPALDPIDIASDFVKDLMDDGIGEAVSNLGTNVLSELPFSSGLTLVGIETDGGRFPVSSAIPNIPDLWNAATNTEWSAEKRWQTAKEELAKPLIYLASPFGGGGQIAKTYKGIKAIAEGGSYTVDSETGEKVLQYPVFKDDGDEVADYLRAGIFGKSALDEAQDWVNGGFKNLSAEETKVYQDLVRSGAKDYEAYNLIKEIKAAKSLKGIKRKKAEQAALEAVQFTEEEERAAVGLILGTDMETDSGNPTEYAKFLTATGAGLSVDRYMEIRSAGVDTDDFLKLVDQGMEVDDAADFALSLKELEPEEGEDRVTDVQEWRLAVDRSRTEAGQLSILRGVMNESQFVKAETATVFDISLDAYVGYYEIREQYDTDGNGSYSQKEVKAAIDSMGKYRLTTDEKAALWQLVTGAKSAKNNPYSVSEGQRVLDYLNDD